MVQRSPLSTEEQQESTSEGREEGTNPGSLERGAQETCGWDSDDSSPWLGLLRGVIASAAEVASHG